MCRGAAPPIMFAMTPPAKSSKVLLVAHRRAEGGPSATAPVRRYRLARLRFPSAPQGPESRFEYLKQVYD